jgi:two-component system chemotaxis sensor kinase CheA
MGDGKVALILDVPGLAQCAGVIAEVRNRSLTEKEAKSPAGSKGRQTVLLLGLGSEHRLAIPLQLVTRLEEIPRSAVEETARQEVVQYRGQILPLIRLADVLGSPSSDEASARGALQVVVYSERGRSMGLVVDRILDVVETAVEVLDSGKRPGILGSAVIQQRVTDLLDLPGILHAADSRFLEPGAVTAGRN